MSETPPLSAEERSRYEWQLNITDFGEAGQRRLRDATVLISRAGGLGGNAAIHLAAAGVGRLILAHAGNAKSSDRHRQLLLNDDSVGQPRIEVFTRKLRELNRSLEIVGIAENPSPENASRLVREADLVIDAAPLFTERFALNQACVEQRKPLVDAALYELEGQVTTIIPGVTPCLACLFPENPPLWKRQFPVISPVSGVLGSLAAMEAIKVLTGIGQPLAGKLLLVDLAAMDFQTVTIARRPTCAVCAGIGAGS